MRFRLTNALLATLPMLALAACGGGGGVSSTPAPPTTSTPEPTPTPPATQTEPPVVATPAPTPAPAPAPTTPTDYNTTEYRRSPGLPQANATTAYNAGITGRGVTAAIVDGGIDTANAEFAGRISAASADVAGTRGSIKDEGGHGTAVAGVLGAARNNSGPMGIAFDATLLIARTDTPGTCATEDGCKHADSAIARGVDLATNNGARVINLSLGGSPPNNALSAAIGRATAAGVVVVISAGNDSLADPDPFASIANSNAQARGLVIIAGATNLAGDIATFSNRAGSGADHYLMALGERVLSYDQNGELFLYSGTSFAAPLVSGAVALLAQAFPNLTGRQIVQLLFSTATDLGQTGVDSTYGQGALNLTRAFQPQGATALAGSAIPVSLAGNATLSPAMGDAGQGGTQAGASTVIVDSYGRAYGYALGESFVRPAPTLKLAPALAGGMRRATMASAEGVVSVSLAAGGSNAAVERLLLAPGETRQARAIAGMAARRIGPDLALAVGYAQGGAALAATLRGEHGDAFLVASDPASASGFERRVGTSMAIRRALGGLGLTLSTEQGATFSPRTGRNPRRQDDDRHGYGLVGLALDRHVGPLWLTAGISRLRETRTVLGARFGPSFGSGGADTDFVDIAAVLSPARDWTVSARLRRGSTRMQAGGAATRGRLTSGARAIDITKQGMFGRHDSFALRVAEPLRVLSGGYVMDLPTAYDYETGLATMAPSRLDLAPAGRERDAEASWATPLATGWLATNLYWRRDPGNIASLPDDVGGAIRYAVQF